MWSEGKENSVQEYSSILEVRDFKRMKKLRIIKEKG
jgi:hypothetical protein